MHVCIRFDEPAKPTGLKKEETRKVLCHECQEARTLSQALLKTNSRPQIESLMLILHSKLRQYKVLTFPKVSLIPVN